MILLKQTTVESLIFINLQISWENGYWGVEKNLMKY